MAGANNILGPIDTSAPNPFRAPISPDFNDPVHMPTIDYSGANSPFAWTGGNGVPTSAPNGGGFWSGLWNHTIAPVWHDIKGAMASAEAPPVIDWSQPQNSNPFSMLAKEPIISGLLHPQQAIDRAQAKQNEVSQSIVNSNAPDWLKTTGEFGTNFGYGAARDPLSLVPIGTIARLAKVPEALNATKNAALNLPGGMNVANALATAFKPIGGARQSFVDLVSRMHGSTQSGANATMNELENMLQNTTPDIRSSLFHALEATAPGTKLADPTLEALRPSVESLLEQATQTALDRGLIDHVINPAEFGVGRYLPHVSATKLDEEAAPFSDITFRKTGVDAAKQRTLQGTAKALNETLPKDRQFETDIAKVLAYHLGQQNKAIAIRDLIDHTMSTGIEPGGTLRAGDWFPGTVQKAVEYSHDGKTVLLPEAEAKFLQKVNTSDNGIWKRLYRGGVNLANRSMFLGSPLIHIGNNLGWQTLAHAPGVIPKMFNRSLWREAFSGVKPGSEMDNALKSGALHLTTELGKKTNAKSMANELVKRIDAKPSVSSPFTKFVASPFKKFVLSPLRFYNNLTPNVEKVYRTAAFQHALDRGMTPNDATRWVRSVYGGNAPGTASQAENALTSIVTFFNWTKTAIGSNTKNFLNNPLPYVGAMHALNAINQMNTGGQNMSTNKNPLSVALGTKNAKGLNEFLLPYYPFLDPLKLGNDMRQQGPFSGVGNFLFGRTTPIVKFPLQMWTKETNPIGLPPDKRSILPSPDLPPNSPFNREPLFGQSGPLVPYWTSQVMQDVMNPVGEFERMSGESPTAQALTNPFVSLYGSVSAPNPFSDAKHAKYLQGQQQGEKRKWLQKFGSQ